MAKLFLIFLANPPQVIGKVERRKQQASQPLPARGAFDAIPPETTTP
jgi:hypothetical protein